MRTEIELECADLESGDSRRLVCPSCRGGRSGERSLNVTRTPEGGLLYLCWRASCDMRGAIGGSPIRLASLVRTNEPKYRVKTDPSGRFIRLSNYDSGAPTIGEVTNEALEQFGCGWDRETWRVTLPVYSPIGRIRGWVLRKLTDFVQGPKTLAIPTVAEPQLGWNLYHNDSQDVIVVEDIPSAIRLGEFNVRAVALNGTHLTDEACEELVAEAENVVFALDRDAFKKSIALEQKLRLHFDKTASLLLPKDFKNQNNEEVVACLSQISWLSFRMPIDAL